MSAGTHGLPHSDTAAKVDLLILGVSPHYRWEAGSLVQMAPQKPFAVWFLVDSTSRQSAIALR
ncbi:MAG: hypothetical protein ACXWZE_13145 [Candidatus Binatia bacterium]